MEETTDKYDFNTYSLEGLNPEQAQVYINDIATQVKLMENHWKKAVEERDLWEDRMKLAREQNREDLFQVAQERHSEAEAKVLTIKTEWMDQKSGLEKLKTQFRNPSFQGAALLDNAEQLLAQLEEMTGGPVDPLKGEFQQQDVNAALDALKARLAQDKQE